MVFENFENNPICWHWLSFNPQDNFDSLVESGIWTRDLTLVRWTRWPPAPTAPWRNWMTRVSILGRTPSTNWSRNWFHPDTASSFLTLSASEGQTSWPTGGPTRLSCTKQLSSTCSGTCIFYQIIPDNKATPNRSWPWSDTIGAPWSARVSSRTIRICSPGINTIKTIFAIIELP